MAASRIALAFHVSPGGCWSCVSHALNADGYVRLRQPWGHEFLHRTIWRLHNGTIPVGHEVDHICGNRACCAPGHLRLLDRPAHLSHTNSTRYSQRELDARRTWEAGEPIDAPARTAARWIKKWKS